MALGLLVVVLTLSLGETSRPDESAGTRASLRVAGANPLVVQGRGFEPREQVKIKAGPRRASVVASTRGTFVIRLARLRCVAGPIVAVGSKGSRAVTRPPPILCVEP